MYRFLPTCFGLAALVVCACAPSGDAGPPSAAAEPVEALAPESSWRSSGRIELGAPVAVFVDFGGVAIVADVSPPRLISISGRTGACQEFQAPQGQPAFRPSDVSVRGFFVYAVDEADRTLLRWDSSGSYRDVLLNFQDLDTGRRISPCGLDVDASGRTAITDIENHRVIVLNTYLTVDVTFGNYGSFAGQLDTPLGVSFTPRGDLLVADSGNARLQVFSDSGTLRRVIPGEGEENPMRRPRRAVAAVDGTVYAADPDAGCVFVFAPDGSPARAFVAEGTSAFKPTDVALGRDGRLFVSDAASKTLFVFKVM